MGELAGGGQLARLGAGVGVLADVLVQLVHVGPALGLAEGLQPGADVEVAGAGRSRVRHDDLALVHRVGQVFPFGRLGQALLLGLDGVEADGRSPHVHADPGRWVGGVAVVGADLVQVGRGVGFEHALLLEHSQARASQAPDNVCLRTILLGQQLGGDNTGGVAYPLDLDIRVQLFEGALVGGQLFHFEGGVHGQLGVGLGLHGASGEQAGGQSGAFEHEELLGWHCVALVIRIQLACGLSPRARRALIASITGGSSARVSIR